MLLVWVYSLLFVLVRLFLCVVKNVLAVEQLIGVKLCTMLHLCLPCVLHFGVIPHGLQMPDPIRCLEFEPLGKSFDYDYLENGKS